VRAGSRFSFNPGKHKALLVIAAGAISVVGGLALLMASLAPMFTPRDDSATVVAPPVAASVIPDNLGSTTATAPPPSAPGPTPAATIAVQPKANGPVNGVSFILRIPVIGYSAMVYQGVTTADLSRGPGHYPTTPWPGQPGNVGVAAHNVYWLSFSRLKVGDRVELITASGLYWYAITGSNVTQPGDRTVLAPTNYPKLTLTTCWPLWAGAFATQRLYFTANAIGGVA
jgi:sortase A